MENLPVPLTVRGLIYKKLDHDSLLQLRTVNSTLKDELDDSPGFNIWIDTNQMSQETFTNLLEIKAHSLRLFNKTSDQGKVVARATTSEWDFSPKYPSFVRTLRLGDKTDFGGHGHVPEHLFFKVLKECSSIEILSIVKIHFYGEHLKKSRVRKGREKKSDLEPKDIIQSMRNLKTLKVHVFGGHNEVGPNPRTIPVLCPLLSYITSPVLTSIDLNVTWDASESMFRNPWSAVLQLISRHWETLSELHLNLIPFNRLENFVHEEDEVREDWTWINTTNFQKMRENFEKMDSLTKFSFENNVLPFDFPVRDLIVNLMRQQKCLEEAKINSNILSVPILRQIVESNVTSLRVLKVDIEQDPEPTGDFHVNENPIDMGIFSNCYNLKQLKMEDPPFNEIHIREIINLGSVPAQVERLTIRGFVLPDGIDQLRALSCKCSKMKQLKLDLTRLSNIRGITSVIKNFLYTSEELQFLRVQIKSTYDTTTGDEAHGEDWLQEVYSLLSFFELFSQRNIELNDDNNSYDFAVLEITPAERARALEDDCQ